MIFATSLMWLQDNGWRLVIILVLWLIASSMVKRFGRHFVQTLLTKEQSIFSRHGNTLSNTDILRIETLSAVFTQVLRTILFTIFGLMVLSQLGIPIAPLFAGASIVGIVIGFGAQSLIKDLASGMLIVFENQYSRGDTITIGEITGQVEEVSLRITVVRDDHKVIHYIPNGSITIVSNLSKIQQ